jgi:glycosyltransferase involved in cell wall biosynthesis
MASDRLLDLFTQFDPQRIKRVFGREFILKAPETIAHCAPVKRVAILTESFLPKVDGVSKSAFLTMSYLKQTGREVLVFAPNTAPKSIGNTRIVPVFSVPFPGVPETRLALPNPNIARQLRAFKPDLIHLFSPALMTVSGMAVGRNLKIPVIANYQTDLPGYTEPYGVPFAEGTLRHWLRYIHNGCHLTLAPSYHTINELRDHGFKRLRPWMRGVDLQRFNPAHFSQTMREKLLNGRDPNSLLCIYVGRLASEKCVDLLVGVAQLPCVALTIIGDGAQREELERRFAHTNTLFTGYLLGADLSAAFASADLFLFTGPNETFGQVTQEAMASGLPTLVTNRGGVCDLVREGETGYICEHHLAAFVEAVKRCLQNPQEVKQMSQQARQIVERRPWEAVMAQLEDYYDEAYDINQRFGRRFGKTSYHSLMRLPANLVG